MKLLPILAIVLAWPVFLSAQDKNEQQQIIDVIEQETIDFTKLPFSEVLKKHWILDEQTYIRTVEPDGKTSIVTLEDLKEVPNIIPQELPEVKKSDFVVQLHGSKATVYHYQVATIKTEGIVTRSHEIRSMEKIGGTWKIHNSTGIKYSPD
jgi:hypothetical protein